MRNIFQGILVGLFAMASVQANAIVCSGYNVIGSGDSFDHYAVTFERSRLDEGPGIPVSVTVKHKLDSNTAKPNFTWITLVDHADGRMLGDIESGLTVTFTGGTLVAKPGNSGITGITHRLQGTLALTGKAPVTISCPVGN